MTFKTVALKAGLATLSYSGLCQLLQPVSAGRGAILMLHRVMPAVHRDFDPNAMLSITPEFLDEVLTLIRDRGFDLIAMDEVPERLQRPERRRFIAISVDDGYRDTWTHAYPVFAAHDAPFTTYITTEFADGQGTLWWVVLEEAVRTQERLTLTMGGRIQTFPCHTAREKNTAFSNIYWYLRDLSEVELRVAIDEMASRYAIDRAAICRNLCMSWDEISTFARLPRVTIAAHTLSHPRLARMPEEAAAFEISESKRLIEAKLGQSIKHFAYPVGDPASAGAREFRLAGEAGYATAVTTRPGMVFAGHADHLLALPRMSLNGLYQNPRYIAALLSGVPFALYNRFRRLSVT